MKKIFKILFLTAALPILATSCIEEIDPQGSYATPEEVDNSYNRFDGLVNAVTSSLAGQFTYSTTSQSPYDFGYPSFFLQRDVAGQDIALGYSGSFFSYWYTSSQSLGPQYAISQVPWTYYYKWIKNCNTVLEWAGESPADDRKSGAGIAYSMRAMFYMDLARMYAQETYADNKESVTVPIVLETTTEDELYNNPRATNEKMWAFIISDLDKAEGLLANYTRSDKYTPDLSVVYGLKARAYLVMEDWPNAQKYARLAIAEANNSYSIMTKNDYTNRTTGFNTPNSSWMFGLTYKANDPNIKENDGDSSWGSAMCLEMAEGGYASNYGSPLLIDRHLYETVPTTDYRRNNFIDFTYDTLNVSAGKMDTLIMDNYSDYPKRIKATAGLIGNTMGGLALKFRAGGGDTGRKNPLVGFSIAVPMMRVEEMYLIEAEAAGMQNVANGVSLLTQFAIQRDPSFTYGTHTDTYGSGSYSTFQNEIWWQRRIEFWGEGLATFDIKRFNKGIVRSYPNSNHITGYKWNTDVHPIWMDLCIVQTETNYNTGIIKNNPTPSKPTSDSSEHIW